ncbi:MAG: glycosyltransferase family 1 protein [Patescibacteria group bacterium]|nr:glycosyltransferase family 4 protein [Patescibacteria group bacterium]
MIIGIDASRAFGTEKTGVEKYSRELLEGLIKRKHDFLGHKVVVFVRGKVKGPSLPKGWKYSQVDRGVLWTQAGLFLGILREKIDVLLAPSHALPILAGFLGRVRMIYVLHGMEMWQKPQCYPFLERLKDKFLIRASIRVANEVIAVSKNTKEQAVKFLKARPDKIRVIYQGVSLRDRREMTEDRVQKVLALYGIKRPYIIYLGRLEARKNVAKLARAFDEFKKFVFYEAGRPAGKFGDLQLVLAGSQGFKYKAIQKEIKRADCATDIIETGYVKEEDKAILIGQARALIMVSLAEGFGRTVLEARRLGVPVLVSRIGVFEELWQGFEGVVFCDPGSARKIKRGIKKVLELGAGEDDRRKRVQKQREKLKEFDREKAVELIIEEIKRGFRIKNFS